MFVLWMGGFQFFGRAVFILLVGGGVLLVWRVFRIFRPEICVFLRVRGAEFCDGIFEGTESLRFAEDVVPKSRLNFQDRYQRCCFGKS